MEKERPRLLIMDGSGNAQALAGSLLEGAFDIVRARSIDEALVRLREDECHAIFAETGDFLPLERRLVGERASLVLDTIGEGVLIVDREGRCTWQNVRMKDFSPEVVEESKRICRQALQIFASQSSPITDQSKTRSKKFAFQVQRLFFEMICSPVVDESGRVQQVVAVLWDATGGKRLQAKIDAIDASGRELARLDADVVEKLTPPERLQLLQEKIIKYSKDLMHFDHFAIRLLDRRSSKLEVVIAEGLPSEALDIDLYAEPEGNGISGYVAATGRSYICHDTEKDPRYVLGLKHSKSSLTVPLMQYDEVVGVYNVESERAGDFTEDDRQFAEIFGRYVATALNMLDLLVVERCTTSGTITDNVLHEMAQPLSDIVTESQGMIDRYIGDDYMREHLTRIMGHVDQIRRSISDVAAGPKAIIGTDQVSEEKADLFLAGRQVLIADDEPNIRNTIKSVLANYGCDAITCKDGYEACRLLDQQGFDLIISDIKMPYRNGYEIFAAAQRAERPTPVILMTGFGYDPHHSIVRASQEGLSSVLFKPFKVDQLIDEVRKALEKVPQATSGDR